MSDVIGDIVIDNDVWRQVMPTVLPSEIPCPVHRRCLRRHLRRATEQLATERFGRCICAQEWCLRGQVTLRAWHLYWAAQRQSIRMRQKLRRRRARRGW